MRWSPHQRFTVEMGIVKACHITPLRPLTEVLARMKDLESRLTPGTMLSAPAPSGVSERSGPYVPKTTTVSHQPRPAEAPGGGGGGSSDEWGRVMSALKSKKPGLFSVSRAEQDNKPDGKRARDQFARQAFQGTKGGKTGEPFYYRGGRRRNPGQKGAAEGTSRCCCYTIARKAGHKGKNREKFQARGTIPDCPGCAQDLWRRSN